MTKIFLSGCNGKMGQSVTRVVSAYENMTIVAGFDQNDSIKNQYPVFNNLKTCNVKADVAIDFSHPDAFNNITEFCLRTGTPLVMATTGLSHRQRMELENLSSKIPVFFSANMSIGVNLLLTLVRHAVTTLGDGFDIEIIEKHHNQKIDSPSGTAFAIADTVNQAADNRYNYVYDRHSVRKKRSGNEIGIHAIRGGTITGDHTVIFAGNDEIIEISHSARSKDIFATGALRAAEFLKDKKPGFYTMKDLLG